MLPGVKFSDYDHPPHGLVAGQLPSPEHAAGTVYVAQQIGTVQAPLTLTEWDLASARSLQGVTLPVKPKRTEPVMVNVAGGIHLVGWGLDGVAYYFRLTPSLQIVGQSPIKGMAGYRPNALATDGALTLVVARRPRTEDPATEFSQTFATTFDVATGRRIASRTLDVPGEPQASARLRDNAVVVGGDAYVLMQVEGGYRILRLDRNLVEVARVLLPSARRSGVSLRVEGDHLVADLPVGLRLDGDHLAAGPPPESFEIPLDLSRLSPVPPPSRSYEQPFLSPCEGEVAMGPIRARLCPRFPTEDTEQLLLLWDREGAREPDAPPLDAGAPARELTEPERALVVSLAGDKGGRSWIPPGEGFASILGKDVLVDPGGGFVTHLREYSGVSGKWRIEGDTLTFVFDGGADPLVITSVRVEKGKLHGTVDGHPVVFQQSGP